MNKLYPILTSAALTSLVFTSLLLSGCDWDLGPSYDPTSETMYVDYYKEACDSSSTDMCFRSRFDTDDAFVLSTVANSGFDDLEWGKRYTLQVEVEYDSSGDDSLYSLLSIDSEEVIDADTNSFSLTFNMSSQILLDNLNNSWIIAAEDVFSCIDSDCTLLTNAYNASEEIELEFNATDDQLTLLDVVCSAAENDFESDCEGIDKADWDIAHYQTDCGTFEPRLCLVYREHSNSDDAWHILPFEITDFTASWGTQYDIEVEVTSSGDAIRSATWLQENSNEDLSGTEFNIVMRTGVQGLQESSSGVISYDDTDFNCALNSVCDDIDDAVNSADSSSERILALLTRVETINESSVFVIQSITCDESSEDDEFKENCADVNDEVIWIE